MRETIASVLCRFEFDIFDLICPQQKWSHIHRSFNSNLTYNLPQLMYQFWSSFFVCHVLGRVEAHTSFIFGRIILQYLAAVTFLFSVTQVVTKPNARTSLISVSTRVCLPTIIPKWEGQERKLDERDFLFFMHLPRMPSHCCMICFILQKAAHADAQHISASYINS